MTRKFLLVCPLYFMLILGLMLPSDGSHGLFAPKSLAFIVSTFCLGIFFLCNQRMNQRQLGLFSFLLCSLSVLLVWFFIGIDQSDFGISSATDQLKLFILTIATVIMTLYVVSEKLTTPQTILKLIILANFTYSCLKLLVVALHLTNILSMFFILHHMGVRFMTMGIIGSVSRLQTSVDIITPFLIIFVLQSKELGLGFGRKFKIIYLIVAILSIFLSFSRFLMFVGFMGCVFYWLSLNITQLMRVLVASTVLGVMAVGAIGVNNVATMVEQRFFSDANYHSDLQREEQINALMAEYDQVPAKGKGVGGYAAALIRDGAILHSYEVQWVAFLMQFGAIGVMFLLAPFGIIAYRLVFPTYTRTRLGFFAMFGLWMFAGFTNPFMISLTSGIVYSMFFLAGDILEEKEKSLNYKPV